MVNFVDLPKQYSNANIDTVFENIKTIIKTGSFVGGDNLTDLEIKFAKFCDSENAVGVGSGTDALILALKAAGIGPGDKVLVPANTFIATPMAVSHVGATPVFVDVDPDTYLITEDTVSEYTMDPSVTAIIPVHLYGNPVDMQSIMSFASAHSLKVVEDCAQAFGTFYSDKHVGSFGDAGCFSFYPAKNLGGLAQGGMVITDDSDIAVEVSCLGNVGRTDGSWFEYGRVGYNSRLDPINAVFINNNLDYIAAWNASRRSTASLYIDMLKDVSDLKLPTTTKGGIHTYHLFEVGCMDKQTRDDLKTFLGDSGINTGLHYPIPCHKQPIYSDLEQVVDLSVSELLSDTLLSLPMHPFMEDTEVSFVCEKLIEFFN